MMAPPEDYLKWIEQMNRRPVQNQPVQKADLEAVRRKLRNPESAAPRAPAEPILYRRDLPHAGPKPGTAPASSRQAVALETAVQGVEAAAPHGGRAYCVTTRLGEEAEECAPLLDAFRRRFEDPETPLLDRLHTISRHRPLRHDDILFVDIETTGLGSTPLFLIGVLAWEGEGMSTWQFLARDYSEESAVISLFSDRLARGKLLVSFNGKSFDLPYIRTRAVATGVRLAAEPGHFDLLHEARRVWGRRMPDCKLQTLERHLCRRTRTGDIPGAEIPEAYHTFVRTGDAAQMAQIIEHNRLDLITMAELLVRLPGGDKVKG